MSFDYTTIIIFFAGAFLFSVLINIILLKFVKTLGIRSSSDTMIRWNKTSKPSIGGIGFFIIFLIAISTQSFLSKDNSQLFNIQYLGILFATSLGFLMGLFDDAYNTKPKIKLLSQILCGVILILTGTYIHLFSYEPFNYIFTIIWVVGMMNSINMLDNMDGVTTIVSLGIILSIIIVHFLEANFGSNLILLLGITAALGGFLIFNFNPSKMFMGDTGSQFLGIFLGALGIIYFWNVKGNYEEVLISKQILLPIMAFAIPIIDTTTVVIKRMHRGSSPFVGGKDHTTHHLSYLGLSDRQVGYVIILLTLISGAFTIWGLYFVQNWGVMHNLIFAAYILLLFITLFTIANKNKHKN